MATQDLLSTAPSRAGNATTNFSQTQQGSKQGSVSGSGSQTAVTNQTQSTAQNTFQSNFTPSALAALEALIQQLSDRPVISQEEAVLMLEQRGIKAPTRLYTGGQWIYTDENGRPLQNYTEWEAANKRYQAQVQQTIQSGGIVAGGTEETRAAAANRKIEIDRNRELQERYSKDAAFQDAALLTDRFSRILLEQAMPQIQRSAEAAGTSGDAVSGLLANDAVARVAEAQAALGLDTAAKYGAISTQLSGVLEMLTRESNPVLTQLLNTLQVAKGAVQSTSSSGVTNTQSVTNTNTNENKQSQENSQDQIIRQALDTLFNPATSTPQLQSQQQQIGDGKMKITVNTGGVTF